MSRSDVCTPEHDILQDKVQPIAHMPSFVPTPSPVFWSSASYILQVAPYSYFLFFFRSPLYWLASFYRTCRMVVVLVRFRCWVLAMPISAWYLWTLNGSILLLPTPPLRCSEGGTRCKLHADPDCQSITRFLARHIAHIGTQACGENLANTYFTSVRILLIA